MLRMVAISAAALMFATSGIAAELDDVLCAKLKAFYRAPFGASPSATPYYRSVTIEWIGAWLDFDHGFGLKCKDTADTPSHELCGWLAKNTPLEFETNLPLGILECHGFQFPHPYPQIQFGHTVVPLWDNERLVLLDMDFRDRKSWHSAVRITVFQEQHDEATDHLAPMIVDPGNPPLEQ